MLCVQFVGHFQIGNNVRRKKRVGWMDGGKGSSSNGGVPEGRGGHMLQLVVGRAVSWQGEGFKTKIRRGGQRKKRERKNSKTKNKTRSVYTKKCSASDSRAG